MTTLDQRLYAWLLESDDRRFELAFAAYFDVAFPSVMRHLARLSRWEQAELEDLAQDALLRFFDKVGRMRRDAAKEIGVCLSQIGPLNFDVFHERLVANWSREVGSLREATMKFRPPEPADTQWKSSIKALTERIPVLQAQGWRLLHSVHLALDWTFGSQAPPGLEDAPLEEMATRNCDQRLVEEMCAGTPQATIAEQSHPGITLFVRNTAVIVRALPLLRVPTNGYLFEIVGTIYLDERKKRGRQKRGGAGGVAAQSGERLSEVDASNHPMQRLVLENVTEDGDERFDDSGPARAVDGSSFTPAQSVDPTLEYESEELFEKFYAYLHQPLDEAIDNYHAAQKIGRAVNERRKVESLTAKFSRTMAVVSSLGEGYTQEQTAERLGLSRNQVKYIIEMVQQAYSHFTDPIGPVVPGAHVTGASNVV